jgi:hypothetical protein
MEFERAIFRVYERCVEGLGRPDGDEEGTENEYDKSCRLFETMMLSLGVFLLFALIYLHVIFVGSAGCLPNVILQQYSVPMNRPSNASLLDKDQMLVMTISDKKFMPTNYLRTDETDKYSYLTSSNNSTNDTSTIGTTSINKTTYPTYSDSYLFSFEIGILALPMEVLCEHNFDIVNITIGTTECFGGPVTQSLIPLVGYDSVIMNMAMASFKKTGYLLTPTRSYLTWRVDDDPQETNRVKTFVDWVGTKVSIVISSLFAFFVLSTVTALLVRVLISSGVVILFPIFWALQMCGMQPINLRIITLSYPWIGVPMELLRTRNQSTVPFLIAHMSRVIMYYVLYEAVQQSVSFWFYSESSVNREDLWLLVIMMVWEYYCMIYVRSASSIMLFPRASLGLFLLFHIYYYSFPAGFHFLALMVMFAFVVFLMIFCIRVFEAKAFRRGLVNIDQTRSMYNTLTLPIWRVDLPPDFSLFQPLTHRENYLGGVYQSEVPPLRPSSPDTPDIVEGENSPLSPGGTRHEE